MPSQESLKSFINLYNHCTFTLKFEKLVLLHLAAYTDTKVATPIYFFSLSGVFCPPFHNSKYLRPIYYIKVYQKLETHFLSI